jgi:hypothetical protein
MSGALVLSLRIIVDAEKIMQLIRDDIDHGLVPVSVGGWSDLASHVDENGYLEDVGQTYDGRQECLDLANMTTDEVDRRIRGGELIADLIAEADAAVRRTVDLYGSWERYQATLRTLCR